MDASTIATAASAFSSAQTGNVVQLTVLKKAQDIEAQGVIALVNALPQPSFPSSLGQNVNTVV